MTRMTQDASDKLSALMTESMAGFIPLLAQMKLKVTEARRGQVAATLPLEGNGNHLGTMYAGALFTVAETLGGVIAGSSFPRGRFYPLVKDLQINFLRPATSGVVARASLTEDEITRIEADAEATGKGEFTLTTEVTSEDGTLVATTSGTYQIRAIPT